MSDWFDAESHVERAHEHFEAGRWAEAESELREALALNPDRADWHFNLGLTLEAAGRYADAADALRAAHKLAPDEFQTLVLLGVNLLRTDEVEEARVALLAARAADAVRVEPHVYLIEAHARLGDHDAAEVEFYRVVQAEPAGDWLAMAYANMGESMMDRSQWERAIACFREASGQNPALPRVHARLAAAYAETGRLERARQLYLRALREDPGDADTLLDLGCLLADMNRLAEAGEKFRRALELDGENPEAHFHLADLYTRQQRRRDAIASYRLVLRLDPGYPGAARRLARLLLADSEVAAARKLVRRELAALRVAGPDAAADADLEDLGSLLLDCRLPRDAALVFEDLAARRAGEARVWHLLSVARLQAGDRRAGVEACRKALRLDPAHVPALHNMALAHVQDRQWRRARYYLTQAQAIDRDDPALRRLAMTIRLRSVIDAVVWLAGTLARRRREDAGI
ncbi:MAG: tetratricopeptide repeat protein [Phycisphaerales bacterium]|nr:tetratricopeptide repeat protein [Phycisphaerales bacterium]